MIYKGSNVRQLVILPLISCAIHARFARKDEKFVVGFHTLALMLSQSWLWFLLGADYGSWSVINSFLYFTLSIFSGLSIKSYFCYFEWLLSIPDQWMFDKNCGLLSSCAVLCVFLLKIWDETMECETLIRLTNFPSDHQLVQYYVLFSSVIEGFIAVVRWW